MHYDVSGPGAENMELRVFRMSKDTREKIHGGMIQTADGYFETDFITGFGFYICFKSLDSEEKDLSFMINQVKKGKINFAQKDHVETVTAKLTDLQDEFDVISHNLSARLNYDADMH